MGRLIDADELIKYIKIWEVGTSISSDQKEFIDCINNQPTVFDVDKVVEQLEKKIQTHKHAMEYEKKNGTITEEFQQRKAVEVLECAIEIVKAGGVDG